VTSLVVVDTNALVSRADSGEPSHHEILVTFADATLRFVVPALCVGEATYLIERKFGPLAEARFLESLGDFEVIAPSGTDWTRIAELVRQYADFPLGGTDASVVALAERLETDLILTLDRRHFATVRPAHCESLRLLPE
jgi:uncharacterized protein